METHESALAEFVSQIMPADLAGANPTDKKIYQLLKEEGPLARDDIVKRTVLPRTTIYDALTRLSVRGVIYKFKEPRQTRGRCRVLFGIILKEQLPSQLTAWA